MAVNVCRLARKTNRKSRKEQQTEELDAPRLPMWSLNPFAHSLHETCPHFSVTGSRGILVDQIRIAYLYKSIFLVFFPFGVVWAQPKAVWRHPLIWGRPPLCGKFCQQPLLRQVNLQPLADFIISRYPAARVPIWNIIETGSPRFVSSDVRPYGGGGDGRIRQEIVFHSKCINTAFCK